MGNFSADYLKGTCNADVALKDGVPVAIFHPEPQTLFGKIN